MSSGALIDYFVYLRKQPHTWMVNPTYFFMVDVEYSENVTL